MEVLDRESLLWEFTILLGGQDQIDRPRADLILDLALQRVGSVVSPIPELARPIVLEVASRGYRNPEGVRQETVGPFARTFAAPGVYLLAQERADLLGLVSVGSGAFTIAPGRRPPAPTW